MQRFGAQVQVRPLRVVPEPQDVGGVDDLRVGALVPALVQGRLPVLFVVDPSDHVGLHHRDRVGDTELHPQRGEVVEEFTGRPGTAGASSTSLCEPSRV